MRHVYFSFHYEDIWKVNQIRNSGVVGGSKSAGFADRSLWEEAKEKSRQALEKLIAEGLEGTSVTAVLIGSQTASRPWVKYEIMESIKRRSALLGVHINKVPDRNKRTANRGRAPSLLNEHGAPIYAWSTAKEFGEWVEEAWRRQNEKPGFLDRIARAFGF
jgi:hypothetical protein